MEEKDVQEFLESAKKAIVDLNKTLIALKKDVLKSFEKTNETMHSCLTSFRNYEKELEHVKKTNENVEETLCNVLVAIRQNEYLQAWYPAQNGYPETKVIGKHPSKYQGK